MPELTEIVLPARLSVVPPFPPVATRLLGMLGYEAVEIKEIAKLVSSDPMFTGRVLQAANSAEFGLLQPIRNVRQALTTLGLERTRRITVTAAAGVYCKVAMRTGELKRCWQHTIATAVLAEEISRRCSAFREVAFSAGIMHDIGRLALLVAYPSAYEKTMRQAAERCLDLLDYEQEVFGFDHSEAGRLLCRHWKLPAEFQLIAGRHHDPCEGVDLDLLRIVHVACLLADHFGYDVTRPLAPLSFEDIIAKLPPAYTRRFEDTAKALRSSVRRGIQAFDGEQEPDDPKAVWEKARHDIVPPEERQAPANSSRRTENRIQASAEPLVRRISAWLYRRLFTRGKTASR